MMDEQLLESNHLFLTINFAISHRGLGVVYEICNWQDEMNELLAAEWVCTKNVPTGCRLDLEFDQSFKGQFSGQNC